MTFFFVEKPSIIQLWLEKKGYNGSLYDALHKYLQTKSSMNSMKIHDLLNDKLTAMGFTGNIQQKLRQFFRLKMNEADWKRAERLFWRDFTTDFEIEAEVSVGITTESGDALTTEDGDQLFTEGE